MPQGPKIGMESQFGSNSMMIEAKISQKMGCPTEQSDAIKNPKQQRSNVHLELTF